MLHILCIPFLFTQFSRVVFEVFGQVYSIKLSEPEGMDSNVITPTPSKNTVRPGSDGLSSHFSASGSIYSDTFIPQYGMEVATRNVSILVKH